MNVQTPVICRCCFEDILPSPENPNLVCPKCGTENHPAISSNTPSPIPPPTSAPALVPPGIVPPPRQKRRLATAEKVVLWFIFLPVGLMAISILAGNTRSQDVILPPAFYAIAVLLYFIPALVGKNKTNANAILLLNIFLGWTVVGWVVALVWATTKESAAASTAMPSPETHVRCPQCAEWVRREARLCKHCKSTLTPQD